jgi:fructokinase
VIVSCGEALIDFLPRTGPEGASLFQPLAGGSPFNVAVAVGRLGSPAGFFGGLSTDFFGETLKAALAASHVDTGLANVSSRPTTLAFVRFENGDARYAFFDEGSAGRMITESDLPALPKTVQALHFGSFSLAAEPCGSALEALMQREQKDRVISLDPNIRPTLIHNREGYLARLDRLVAMADIVKLSGEDLAWLDPGARFEDRAARWLLRGAKLVVLTRGSEGATAVSAAGRVSAPAPQVKVADTVGAGDTFMAALLVRLEKAGLLTKPGIARLTRDHVTDLLAFAAKAAAVTVSRPGADPPWLNELI